MAEKKLSDESRAMNWKVIGIVALLIAVVFFWPFLGVIVFAIVMSMLFHPLYKWLEKFLPNGVAAATTVFVSVAIVFIPVMVVLGIALAQGVSLANNVAHVLQVTSTDTRHKEIAEAVDQINTVIDPISNGQVHLTVESIRDFFSKTMPKILKTVSAVIISFASSIPSLISSLTVYLFLFFAFIMNSKTLPERLRIISPFDRKLTDLYIQRTQAMVHASIISQLLIAFILGLSTALLLLLINGPNYFIFWVLVLTLLSMVPVGSSIVVYPLSIIAILQGNVAGGVWVILIYSFIICNMDNLMRPRLIPKKLQLPPALMTLSIFCGLFYFGILGVVYGPVIVILLITTYDTYLDYKRQQLGLKPAKL